MILAETRWLYECTADNAARFVLGTLGDNPLICFGINPSTAKPGNLDSTVNYVSRIASFNGYDSFIMLNVYPQRATNPNDLHKAFIPELKIENERHISALINGRKLNLWAAWGNNIKKRHYLLILLHNIVSLPEMRNCRWMSRGTPTKDRHPHHPLYVNKDYPFEPFDIGTYINNHR